MRPGEYAPEERRWPRGRPSASSSFNEAGARTPRKRSLLLLRLEHGQTRFNEAGARTPRKRPRRRAESPLDGGFNEAGARTPRKRNATYRSIAVAWRALQ